MWYDPDVNRLNYDEHGKLLGEFNEEDSILVVLDNGDFYITNFDANNHYEPNIHLIEKWDPDKIWTAVLLDADQQGYAYLKRFRMEATKRHQNYLGENPNSQLLLLTDTVYPLVKVVLGGTDKDREPITVDAEEFISVKGFKARGKRITTCHVAMVEELEPLRQPEDPAEDEDNDDSEEVENLDPDAGKSEQQIISEITGQLFLFNDDEA